MIEKLIPAKGRELINYKTIMERSAKVIKDYGLSSSEFDPSA